MVEHARVWLGRVAPGKEAEHEAFVAWLRSGEAQSQFARYLLTGYSLYQADDRLKVVMRAEEPLAFIRFLRNARMWPSCWEFVAAGRGDHPGPDLSEEHGQVRVDWRRDASGVSRSDEPSPQPPTLAGQSD